MRSTFLARTRKWIGASALAILVGLGGGTAFLAASSPMAAAQVTPVAQITAPDLTSQNPGFANLVDLLRAAGRDGSVRVDRDRQGVIRVFQGTAVPASAPALDGLPRDEELDEETAAAERAAAESASYEPPAAPEVDVESAAATADEDVESADGGEEATPSRKRPARRRKTAVAKPAATAAPRVPRARRARR